MREDISDDEINIEDLLKNISLKKLIDFVVKKAKYDAEFTNAILLEFFDKSGVKTREFIFDHFTQCLKESSF